MRNSREYWKYFNGGPAQHGGGQCKHYVITYGDKQTKESTGSAARTNRPFNMRSQVRPISASGKERIESGAHPDHRGKGATSEETISLVMRKE